MPPSLIRAGAATLALDNSSPKSTKVPHWHQRSPDAVRWDQSYPYQLLGVRRDLGGAWSRDPKWIFTLPIPPQSMRISMVAPSELIINESGAVEVVDDVRLRIIQLSGTTGMLPLRPSIPIAARSSVPIFAGAIDAVNSTASAFRALAGQKQPGPFLSDSDVKTGTTAGGTSGYVQFLLLEQFFERYFSAKKRDPALFLALAIWKTQQVYLLKLNQFDLTRSVPRVHHWDYSISAESWARISLDASPKTTSAPKSLVESPSKLAAALQAVGECRRVLAKLQGTITSAVGDATNLVSEPLREVSLILSGIAGTAATLADMPRGVIQAARVGVLSLLSARDSLSAIPRSILDRLAAAGSEVDQLRALGAHLGASDTRTANLQLGGVLLNSPALAIFDDPEAHLDFFSALRPGDLHLPAATTAAIAAERTRVAQFRRTDFEDRRTKLQLASDRLADSVGLGRSEVAASRPPVDSDYEALFALNQAAMVLDTLAAHAPTTTTAIARAMDYVSGLASAAGVPFQTSPSKVPVPYPYGCTLEQVAERYLGDPDRWVELATLNQLADPYVDEIGYRVTMLSNPSGNRVTVGSDGAQLRPGQAVKIVSTLPEALATVYSVAAYGAAFILTLDVDASRYQLDTHAYLHAYLPGTVHGGQVLWVPSNDPPAEDDFGVRDPRFAYDADPMSRLAGTDLLLDPSGDLVLTRDGDFRYARGLALVTQVVREVVGTPRGSKLRHPSFGLPEVVGENVGSLSPSDLAQAVRDAFTDDPLFSAVESVSVDQVGGKVIVGASLQVHGMGRAVPMQVEVG